MSNSNLDNDVVAISAFSSWNDMMFSIEHHGYIPTVHPEGPAHSRVRAALSIKGHLVHPPAQVKVAGLTPAQTSWLDLYVDTSKDTSCKRTNAEAKAAVVTKTTATMTALMADDAVEWLHGTMLDQLEMQELVHDTYNKINFAKRSIEKSFGSLIGKIEASLMDASCYR